MAKPGIPKGTRDFSPIEVSKRQYIIQIIKNNFEKFGYQPIETPSFENSETLMGKYGEEGDRLIFKILNSGDYLKDVRNDIHYSSNINAVFFDIFDVLFLKDSSQYKETLSKLLKAYSARLVSEEESEFLLKLFLNFEDDFIVFQNNELEKEQFIVASLDFRRKLFTVFANNYFEQFEYLNSLKTTKKISEKALRYDLTVPFARYVVQHQNDIEFPFKRYQIQPVWRADRPQKGRFREFYQCDADVVGSTSLFQEMELVQLYDSVFTELGLEGVTIKINNRKILSGIAEVIGASDKLIDFTVALDKLDKIGEDGVKKEMLEKGISAEAIEKVQPLFNFTGTISEKINKLSDLLSSSEEGKKGVEELQFICEKVVELGLKKSILDLDVTLARGLNYYTGAIFEVAPPKTVAMGSIGGGGRYDDLTGIFGLKNMSGVGISFGLDRIYLVIDELNLFPETVTTSSKAIFFNYGIDEAFYSMKIISQLRDENIKVELYPDKAKMDKQFKYAEKRLIPFAVMVGNNEIETKTFSVKNLLSGEKLTVDYDGLKELLQ